MSLGDPLTGEQLFGFAPFAPGSGGGGGGGGSLGAAPALPRGGEADVDRGFPLPPTHRCNGDSCAGRRATGNGGGRFVDPLSGGDTGQCAPVALGRAGDRRLLAALGVANAALAAALGVARRRARR